MNKSNPSNPNISALETHLGFWLRFVSNHVSARFAKLLEEQGVTVTEWVAMRTLYGSDATTHADLIDALGMTKGAASKLVTRLEEKGLAARHLAEGRAREQVLALTDAGQRLVPRLAAIADQNDAHFFAHLEPAQSTALMALLKDVVRIHQLKEVPVA
jgi:DNA-binding MarR family transcriptional regulator